MNAEVAGANPVGPPNSIWELGFGISNPQSETQIPIPTGAVAERRMHFAVDEDDDGSSPFGPANSISDLGFRIWD